MADVDYNDVINRSFQEDLSRYNSKKINTGEGNNVVKLFKEVQCIKTDCNICYDNNIDCIQCFNCDFKYCKECLTKIISEFKKCSACQINLKDTYDKLKDKNKKRNVEIPKVKKSSPPIPPPRPANSNFNINVNEYSLLSDYEIEQLEMLFQMENMNINSSQHTNNQTNNNLDNDLDNALDNEFNNEIETCQFQHFKSNSIFTFNVQINKDNNELNYISNDYNLHTIVINYKLLDTYFQRTLFLALVELTNKPKKFKNIWKDITHMIYNFTCNYSHLISTQNFKNKQFEYQKQDLINTINQIIYS